MPPSSSASSTTITPSTAPGSGRAKGSRFPVTPAVLRSIFASSRTTFEERSLSRVAFFRFAGFVLSCVGISLAAARGRIGGLKSAVALLGPAATPDSIVEDNPLAVARPVAPDLLLIIFVHGFKGTDETFGPFPGRLQHILSESIPNVSVECILFPAYETKGVLREAVDRFADWLVTMTVEREVANGTGGGAGKAKLVLVGHSMGGLLVADTLIQMADARVDKAAPLWPRIIAIIAFDTPYLGLHPHVFKNQAVNAAGFLQSGYELWQSFGSATGSTTPTTSAAAKMAGAAASTSNPAPLPAPNASGWARWAPTLYAAGSGLAAVAVGAAAYSNRAQITDGYAWLTGHVKYAGHLWEQDALKDRLARLCAISAELGISFKDFFTFLPPKAPAHTISRTFCILPADGAQFAHWKSARNSLATDEIEAHCGMFEGKTNDGYYQLGLDTVAVIREAMMMSRGIYDTRRAEDHINQEELLEKS